MQDSQNGLKLASAAPEQGPSSSFFGSSTVSETEPAPTADAQTSADTGATPAEPVRPAAIKPPKAASGLTVKAAPQPPPVAAPPAPSVAEAASTPGGPGATKPWPPPPKKCVAPPPIPVQSRGAPRPSAEPSSGGHGKLWLGLFLGLLLLVGAGVWGVRVGVPMVLQRMVDGVDLEWVEMEMPTLHVQANTGEPWPYIEVNGVHGSGESARAILSGEVVPLGKRSRDGVEVVEVESGRVLLRFGGQERFILVGDRTY